LNKEFFLLPTDGLFFLQNKNLAPCIQKHHFNKSRMVLRLFVSINKYIHTIRTHAFNIEQNTGVGRKQIDAIIRGEKITDFSFFLLSPLCSVNSS